MTQWLGEENHSIQFQVAKSELSNTCDKGDIYEHVPAWGFPALIIPGGSGPCVPCYRIGVAGMSLLIHSQEKKHVILEQCVLIQISLAFP